MFDVKSGANLSIYDIHKHQSDGGSVLRSAHVGNFNTPTLFLAQEGFPIILHEHIRGDAKIYKPAYIRIAGQEIKIADNTNLPLTHLKIDQSSKAALRDLFGRDFSRPAQIHYGVLKGMFPNNVQLTSQLFLEQDQFLTEVLEILAKEFPHLFANFVDSNGKVFNLSGRSDDHQEYKGEDGEIISISVGEIARETYKYLEQTVGAIEGSDVNPEGIVMKSNLYILLSTLCDIYKGRSGVERFNSEKVTVIHFSGVEMINYLIKNVKQAPHNLREINLMYESLVGKLGGILPRKIDFRLIPTGPIGELVTVDETKARLYENLLDLDRKLAGMYAGLKQDRNSVISEVKSRLSSMDDTSIKTRLAELNLMGNLPRAVSERISEVSGLALDEMNRKRITGAVLSAEIAIIDLSVPESESAEFIGDVISVKTRLAESFNTLRHVGGQDVSQYDLFRSNKRIFFPEIARNISQGEIAGVMTRSGEIAREIDREVAKENSRGAEQKLR